MTVLAMKYEKVNPERLKELFNAARERGDFSDNALGECVKNIVRIVLSAESLAGYTEDWQLEMFGNACYAVYRGMKTADGSDGRKLFNYFYTTARNSCKNTLGKLKRNDMAMGAYEDIVTETALEPFHLRNKSRLLRGVFERGAPEAFKAARLTRKERQPMLERIVNRAVSSVSEGFDEERISKLLERARTIRGAEC